MQQNNIIKYIRGIVNVYVLYLCIVFPLIIHDAYFDIQDVKMYAYMGGTITAGCLTALLGLIWFITNIKANKKTFLAELKEKLSLNSIREHLYLSDYFAIAFTLIFILATCLSGYPYEAFWGNMGRYQGCLMYLLYMLTYILISRFYTIKRAHIDAFVAVGLIINVWAVLDYLWLSPIGWQIKNAPTGIYSVIDFSSTIGNRDVLAGISGVYLLVSSAMYIGYDENDKKAMFRKMLYILSVLAAFLGLIAGSTDNALISIGLLFALMPFYAFKNAKNTMRYIDHLPIFALSLLLIKLLSTGRETILYRAAWSILTERANGDLNFLISIFTVCLAVDIIGRFILSRNYFKGEKKVLFSRLRIIWTGLLGIITISVLVIFIRANRGELSFLSPSISNILIFDDKWGTYRGYNWKLLMNIYNKLPFLKKLIGAGPETYPIYTYTGNYFAMLDSVGTVFDNPHNEWLQYLFSEGILGFIAYYGLVTTVIVGAFRVKENKNVVIPMAFGLLAYTVTSFVNISVVITVPIIFMIIAMLAPFSKRKEQKSAETVDNLINAAS